MMFKPCRAGGAPTLRVAFLLSLALSLAAAGARAASTRFDRDAFDRMRAGHVGQPWIVHVWGVSCAPCMKELPKWGQLMRRHPRMRLVLVQADAAPPALADKTLRAAGLAAAPNWAAREGLDEFDRARIDPSWIGDMPRTLLIAANGEIMRMRGTADLAAVERWITTGSELK